MAVGIVVEVEADVAVGAGKFVEVGEVDPAVPQKFPGTTAFHPAKLKVFPFHSKTSVFDEKTLPDTVNPLPF